MCTVRWAYQLLEHLVESQPIADWRLFRASSSTLRRKLNILCRDLGWEGLRFVPHSLLYGGAVFDKSLRGLSIEDIKVRGRWKILETCEAYVTKGLGRLFNLRIPPQSRKALARAERKQVRMQRLLRLLRGSGQGGVGR